MAFEQGTASGVSDLFDKLSTFLVAEGWTDRALTTGGSKGFAQTSAPDQIEVQFQWDTGTPANVGVYQSLGFVGVGTAPGSHTDDSGQGVITTTNATLATGRHVTLVDSSMPYWFFEDDYYCHVVVQIFAGPPEQLVHFGFGNLTKRGTWTGGAYCYGWKRSAVTSTPIATDLSILLDGLATGSGMTPFLATLHAEDLQNQTSDEEWYVISADSTNVGTDRNGDDRHFVQGGFRGGLTARFWSRPSAQAVAGLIPMYPIPVYYLDLVPAIDEVFPLGTMPDVFGVNIEHFTVGDEVDQGGETYVVFPSFRNNGGGGNDTRLQGIAYRKVV